MTEEENNISPFINILYQVIHKCSLDKEEQNICRWSSNGCSFLVLNGDHFMSLIHEFQKSKQRKQRIKTRNYRSLRRNLNYYKFSKSKIISSFDKKEIVGDAFCHISGYFQRDYPRLSMIKTSCIDKTISLKEFNPKRTPLVENKFENEYLETLGKRTKTCGFTLENSSLEPIVKRNRVCGHTLENIFSESSRQIYESFENNTLKNNVSMYIEDIQAINYELGEIMEQQELSPWEKFNVNDYDQFVDPGLNMWEEHSTSLIEIDLNSK